MTEQVLAHIHRKTRYFRRAQASKPLNPNEIVLINPKVRSIRSRDFSNRCPAAYAARCNRILSYTPSATTRVTAAGILDRRVRATVGSASFIGRTP